MVAQAVNKVFQNEKLTMKEMLSYSVSGFGQNMICGLMSGYVMMFYTDVYLVPPMAVAVMMFCARIFDAFNDPVMGSIVDKTRTRWGKLRPYMLFTPVPIGILTILCFCSPNLSNTMKIVYISCTYVLWGVIFTIIDVPYWGLAASMSPDTQERNKLLTWARMFCTAGGGVPLVIPLITGAITNGIKANFDKLKDPLTGKLTEALAAQQQAQVVSALKPAYFWIALGITLVGAPLFWFAFSGTKERAPLSDQPPTLRHNLSLLFKNKPLLLLVLSGILGSLKMIYTMGLGLYVCKYNLQNESLYMVMTVLVVPAGLLASVLTPFCSKKFGKRNVFIVTHLIQTVVLVAMYFVGYDSRGKLVFLAVCLLILGMPSGFSNILTYAMIADTVDYLELKTGERGEGICFAMQTFISKMGMAFTALVTGLTLGVLVYIPNDFTPAPTMLSGIYFMATMGAAISSLLCVIPLFFYKFNEKEQLEARKEIDARNSANQ